MRTGSRSSLGVKALTSALARLKASTYKIGGWSRRAPGFMRVSRSGVRHFSLPNLSAAYLVAGNEGAEAVTFSQEFKVFLGCLVVSGVCGVLWYAITRDTDDLDD